MSIKLGFPAPSVNKDSNECHEIWCWTQPMAAGDLFPRVIIETPERSFPLSDFKPFGDGGGEASYDKYWKQIQNMSRNLHFEISTFDLLGGSPSRLKISGPSAHLCFELLTRLDIQRPADDARVQKLLCSGRMFGDKLVSLVGKETEETLATKVEHAYLNKIPLLLSDTDVAVVADHGWECYLMDNPVTLPSWEKLQRGSEERFGALYAMPGGNFRANVVELGSILGLEPLTRAEQEEPDSEPEQALPAPSLANLYSRSLPSDDAGRQAYESLRDQDPQLTEKVLFELGRKALELGEQLYCNSDRPSHEFDFQHVLISGPTGCGKTALMQSLVLNCVVEREGTCVFIAPTRELVYEFYENIKSLLSLANFSGAGADSVVCSTGEVVNEDFRIHLGDFKVVCIVSEKVNVLFDMAKEGLLTDVSLVIIDELHMIADESRGGVVDSLLGKLFEEVGRRFIDDHPSLQIVGITTESMHQALAPCFARRDDILCDDEEAQELLPLIVEVKERPVPVEHHVAVLGSHVPHLRKIMDFKTQCDRRIDTKENSNEFRTQVLGSLGKNASDWTSNKSKSKSTNPALIKLCQQQLTEHRSIMVALSDIKGLNDIANVVAKYRDPGDRFLSNGEVAELKLLLEKSGIAQSTQNKVLKRAQAGVFMHYSGLPLALKSWVVGLFSKERASYFGNIILFTTETLAYGVNLSADCVILGHLKWTRANIHSPTESKKEDIDQNGFHNILGRAGRAGVCHNPQKAKAIVCIPARDFSDPASRRKFLNTYYYSPEWQVKSKSPTVSRLIDRRALRLSMAAANNTRVDEFSFPTFRSIMDGLRHAGGANAVSVEQLLAFLHHTIYWKNSYQYHGRLKVLVNRFLEAAADYSVKNSQLKLLVANPGYGNQPTTYQIQPQGEALIDTGTRLQSIEPIAEWLSLLRGAQQQLKVGAEVPVELLVPGFVASPDFWAVGKKLAVEAINNFKQPPPEDLLKQEGWAKKLLSQELIRLGLGKEGIGYFEQLMEVYCQRCLGLLFLRVSDCKKNVFFKLVAAVLMWLRGADLDEIATTYKEDGKDVSKAPEFQPKYADRLGWLSVMAHRFFNGSDYFLAEHERDLPQLSLRLRLGMPVQGLPFLGNNPAKAIVSRYQIREMLDCDTRPSDMLWFKRAKGADVQIPDIAGVGPAEKQNIVTSVQQYFESQIKEFGGNLFTYHHGDIAERWQSYGRTLETLVLRPTMEFRQTQKDMAILSKVFIRDILQLVGEDDDDSHQIELFEPSPLSLKLKTPNGQCVTFDFVCAGDDSTGEHLAGTIRVLTLWPWPQNLRPDVKGLAVTSFGAIVLAVLLARQFVALADVNQLFELDEAYTGQIVPIKRLLSVLPFDDLHQTPIRETLLKFFEPGIND